MSTTIQHYLNGVQFVPVNNDDFELTFAKDPNVRWSNDINSTSSVRLPQEQYIQVLNHMNTFGIQRAMNYDIMVGNSMYNFISDLMENTSFSDTEAQINIDRFKSKDDVIKSLSALTFESMFQDGFITEADLIRVPYVVVKDNQGEILLTSGFLSYFLATQIAESISTLARLVAELVSAVTPDLSLSPGIKLGDLIKYSLLILLETAKLVAFSLAFKKLYRQFMDVIYPPLKYYKAMTVDRLLVRSLARFGITYDSTLRPIFGRIAIIPVPIDYKNTKWFELNGNEDNRIVNRGYPTSSDTVSTPVELIDELEKMFNLRPVIRGSILHLEPKGTPNNQSQTVIQSNKNLQDLVENNFSIDCTEMWKTKILKYTADPQDIMLFDNPRGMGVEYQAYTDDTSEFTRLRGYNRIDINFALATVKKETFVEKAVRSITGGIDNFLGLNLSSKANDRKGCIAVSQSQFSVTKMIYQVGGKQPSNYLSFIGANSLWEKYHYMDVPKNLCFRNYSNMPVGMNNEIFNGIVSDNFVNLETGELIEVTQATYIPDDSEGTIDFRLRDPNFAQFIKTKKVYEY